MKKYLCIVMLLGITISYCQTDAEIDALTTQMCKTLQENKSAPDTTNVNFVFQKHLPDFLEKHNINTEEKYNSTFDKIYIRFQKNCPLFVSMLVKIENRKDESEILETVPVHKISKKDCKKLTGLKKFYYLEPDGTKVHVTVDKGKWTEKFEDGTYSLLNFEWTGDCEFVLEFIESDNHTRKNLSSKGNKYYYGIYDQKGNDLKFYVKTSTQVVYSTWLHAE